MLEVVDILMISVSGALLSAMYDRCLEEGMIFERLGKFLNSGDQWWKKPLGGCIFCTSVYITAGMWGLYEFAHTFWQILTVISLSFFLITIMVEHELL